MVSILRKSRSHHTDHHNSSSSSYDSSDSGIGGMTRNQSASSYMRRKPSPPPDVPKGSLAVYVGEEGRRFVIPISYLSHPLLLELLKKSEEEYGFSHDGAMHLPCNVLVFYRVLERIESEILLHNVKFPRGPIGLTVLM